VCIGALWRTFNDSELPDDSLRNKLSRIAQKRRKNASDNLGSTNEVTRIACALFSN
jgi:hypothetical protein